MTTEEYYRKLLKRLARAFRDGALVDHSTQDFEAEIESALDLPETPQSRKSTMAEKIRALDYKAKYRRKE